jgi:ABC-type molybdate transport system permease subunit
MDENKIPPTALMLSLLGVLPLLLCAFSLATGFVVPLINDPALALVTYCAVILSFLGGVRWGYALRIVDPVLQKRALITSVVPALVAWILVLPPTLMGFIAMPILFLLMGALDDRLPSIGAPLWYRKLRRLMTAIVVLTLIAAVFALTHNI